MLLETPRNGRKETVQEAKKNRKEILERFCTKYKNQAVIFCKLGPHVILDKLLAYGKNTKKRAQKYTS